ncbi:MAG: hypothetical protein ACKV22_13665 [Bryobacteraceae bacterium]
MTIAQGFRVPAASIHYPSSPGDYQPVAIERGQQENKSVVCKTAGAAARVNPVSKPLMRTASITVSASRARKNWGINQETGSTICDLFLSCCQSHAGFESSGLLLCPRC